MGKTLKYHRDMAVVVFGEESPAVQFLNEKIKECGENNETFMEESQLIQLLIDLNYNKEKEKEEVDSEEEPNETESKSPLDNIDSILLGILVSKLPIPVMERAMQLKVDNGKKILEDLAKEPCEEPKDFFSMINTLGMVENSQQEVASIIKVFEELAVVMDSFHLALSKKIEGYKGSLPWKKSN